MQIISSLKKILGRVKKPGLLIIGEERQGKCFLKGTKKNGQD